MRPSDYFKYAFLHIGNKKARSFLTILGVALSVMAMVSIVSIAQGFGIAIEEALNAQFTTNTIVIVDPLGAYTLSTYDIDKIKLSIPSSEVQRISAVKMVPVTVISPSGLSVNTLLAGVNFSDIRYIWPILYSAKEGTLPTTDWDIDQAVIGHALADKLKLHEGDTIRLQILQEGTNLLITKTVTIRAILNPSGMNLVGVDVDSAVLMNIKLVMEWSNPPNFPNKISLILVQFTDSKIALASQSDIQDGVFNGNVRAVAFAAYAKAIQNVVGLFNSMLVALIIIAVVIAGVGVMNTMFTSVRERVKEIGTNRAVGAKASEILTLFIIEAFIIAILGMILGTMMGIGAVYIIDKSNFLQSSIQLGGVINIKASPVLSPYQIVIWNIIILIATIGFSYLPSRRASKIEPITALRYE